MLERLAKRFKRSFCKAQAPRIIYSAQWVPARRGSNWTLLFKHSRSESLCTNWGFQFQDIFNVSCSYSIFLFEYDVLTLLPFLATKLRFELKTHSARDPGCKTASSGHDATFTLYIYIYIYVYIHIAFLSSYTSRYSI